MKFYGKGVVWDKTNNKALCRFVNGEFETDDRRTQRILESMGYAHEVEAPPKDIPKKKGAKK
jgi:hypothetical protein